MAAHNDWRIAGLVGEFKWGRVPVSANPGNLCNPEVAKIVNFFVMDEMFDFIETELEKDDIFLVSQSESTKSRYYYRYRSDLIQMITTRAIRQT